tara:strand:+ start:108 stop:779 length:672 start_codon:yes stop_codon:yes gene_type:complete
MNGKIIQYEENQISLKGYLSLPKSGKGIGLIVIQEWWGLVDHIKKQTDMFAENGFIAFAPDLYEGTTAEEPDHAMTLMHELEMPNAANILKTASRFISNHEGNITGKVGCVGYCMGGGMSLYLAAMQVVDAAVPYYGVLTKGDPDWNQVTCPIQGHYAENDPVTDQVPELKKTLDKLGIVNNFYIYPETEHAFCNDDRPEVYDKHAAELSSKRTIEFLMKELS